MAITSIPAYVPYCTSDCYTGTRNASSETEGLIFHGKYVVKAVLEDLVQNTWISEAEEVLPEISEATML